LYDACLIRNLISDFSNWAEATNAVWCLIYERDPSSGRPKADGDDYRLR
jgi:hypothetical protein